MVPPQGTATSKKSYDPFSANGGGKTGYQGSKFPNRDFSSVLRRHGRFPKFAHSAKLFFTTIPKLWHMSAFCAYESSRGMSALGKGRFKLSQTRIFDTLRLHFFPSGPLSGSQSVDWEFKCVFRRDVRFRKICTSFVISQQNYAP